MKDWNVDQMVSMDGKVVVVTGGNSGLGYESIAALGARGAECVMASRSANKARAARDAILTRCPNARIQIMSLDLASLASVRSFAEEFKKKYERLDVLMNNAGVMAIPERRTADGFEMQFGTNHLGHFALTGRLLDVLLATAGSRVVSVTSLAADTGRINFDDLMSRKSYSRWTVYGQSKLANMLFGIELQRRLKVAGRETMSMLAHPGVSATNLQKGLADEGGIFGAIAAAVLPLVCQSQAMGALPQLYAATAPELSGGEYIAPRGFYEMYGLPKLAKFPRPGRDAKAAWRLWDASVELTGVDFAPL